MNQYAIRIINSNGDITFAFLVDPSLIVDGEVNLMKAFQSQNMDPTDLFNQGNQIVFGELIDGEFNLMHEFKKWW